jgi:hypothetical protein
MDTRIAALHPVRGVQADRRRDRHRLDRDVGDQFVDRCKALPNAVLLCGLSGALDDWVTDSRISGCVRWGSSARSVSAPTPTIPSRTASRVTPPRPSR